jgi:hypothetical protein
MLLLAFAEIGLIYGSLTQTMCSARSRMVAGSIHDDVIGIVH